MKDDAVLNTVAPGAVRTTIRMSINGQVREKPLRLRPIMLADDTWISENLNSRNLGDGILDDDLTDTLRVFCHQLFPDDLAWLTGEIGYDGDPEDHVAVADQLMRSIESDPHEEPNPVQMLIDAVMLCRSRSWPENMEPADVKKKRLVRLWFPRLMKWSLLFAAGYTVASKGWIESIITGPWANW